MLTKTLEFFKLSGAGNDFIIVDENTQSFKEFSTLLDTQEKRSRFTVRVCEAHFGVGADGVVFIKATNSQGEFVWDFYNADGSLAEMCGNAARCVGRYLFNSTREKKFKIITTAGPVLIEANQDELITVQMPEPKLISEELSCLLPLDSIQGSLINTGVPHFVIHPNETERLKFHIDFLSEHLEVSRALRFHKIFGTAGANVTWTWRDQQQGLCAVTYERGVEDFTLACGTGAVAACLVNRVDQVKMPGGLLSVTYKDPKVLLSGESNLVFVGYLQEDFINGSNK